MAEVKRIVIKGDPPTAWGANNKQLFIRGGRPGMTEGKNARETRKWLSFQLAGKAPTEPMLGPVMMQVVITWPWLGRHSKKQRQAIRLPKTTAPDGDNCLKTLKDVMEDLGFYCNDAQVYSESIQRFWGDNPGVTIVLESVGLANPRDVI